MGLARLFDQHRRREVGEQIAAAYMRTPQTADELAGLELDLWP